MRYLLTPILIILMIGLSIAGGAINWKIFHADTDLKESGFYTQRGNTVRARGCKSSRSLDEVAYLFPPETPDTADTNAVAVAAVSNTVAAVASNAVAPVATNVTPPTLTSNTVAEITNMAPENVEAPEPSPAPVATNTPPPATPPAPPEEPAEPENIDQEVLAIEDGLNLTAFEEVDILRKDPLHVIIDARTPGEYADGHIPGAISVPFEFASRKKHNAKLEEITEGFSRPVVIYCGGKFCDKARELGNYMKELGQGDLLIFVGGYHDWTENSGETEK